MGISSQAIRDLYNEHNAIMILLEVLDAVSAKLKRGGDVKKEDIERMVEFIRTFADKCHHGKEEGILIPSLKANKYRNTALIQSILGEHQSGRDFVRGMQQAIGGYRTGNADAYHFAVNADAYVALLLTHIRKENVRFLPDSEATLGEKEKDRVMKRFDYIEEHVIGKGKHEHYHELLKKWQQTYL